MQPTNFNCSFPSGCRVPSTIVIGGPTASGKTALAIHLAENLQNFFNISAEIINADSVQMYKDLKILTAYPSEQELARVPHRLFGILEPQESSSVASWLARAKIELDRLKSENKVAILCGGTGFYLRAIFEGIAEIPEIPQEVRQNVWNLFKKIGRDAFFQKLTELDPETPQKLHKNDTQRILRAYEVIEFTGKTLKEWWEEKDKDKRKNKEEKKSEEEERKTLVLLPERDFLRKKAAKRIEKMLNNGAIEEVEAFNAQNPEYDGPLKEVIGYSEVCEFLQSSTQKRSELVEKISIRTNQYIKRQFTWFKNQLKDATFIDAFGDSQEALSAALEECIIRITK